MVEFLISNENEIVWYGFVEEITNNPMLFTELKKVEKRRRIWDRKDRPNPRLKLGKNT